MLIGTIFAAASNYVESWQAKYIGLIDMHEELRYRLCTYICMFSVIICDVL